MRGLYAYQISVLVVSETGYLCHGARDPFSVRYELARFLPIKKRGKDHDSLTPQVSRLKQIYFIAVRATDSISVVLPLLSLFGNLQ